MKNFIGLGMAGLLLVGGLTSATVPAEAGTVARVASVETVETVTAPDAVLTYAEPTVETVAAPVPAPAVAAPEVTLTEAIATPTATSDPAPAITPVAVAPVTSEPVAVAPATTEPVAAATPTPVPTSSNTTADTAPDCGNIPLGGAWAGVGTYCATATPTAGVVTAEADTYPAPLPTATCTEDMACWDCATMGNKICGNPDCFKYNMFTVTADGKCSKAPVDSKITNPTDSDIQAAEQGLWAEGQAIGREIGHGYILGGANSQMFRDKTDVQDWSGNGYVGKTSGGFIYIKSPTLAGVTYAYTG